MPLFYLAIELEVVKELLPLGDAVIGALVTLITAGFTYLVGRKRNKQEIENLRAEKTNIEAASGVSTAEAARVISTAATEAIKPLLDRLQELKEENAQLDKEILDKEACIRDYKYQVEDLRTHAAKLAVQNKLMREKFRLQGESPPDLPPEVT